MWRNKYNGHLKIPTYTYPVLDLFLGSFRTDFIYLLDFSDFWDVTVLKHCIQLVGLYNHTDADGTSQILQCCFLWKCLILIFNISIYTFRDPRDKRLWSGHMTFFSEPIYLLIYFIILCTNWEFTINSPSVYLKV